MAGVVDLHSHSMASDGRLTPVQLVERARSLGLRALALTDHDTLAGLTMFHQAGKKNEVETISGVEVSVDYERGTMHVLGLFVDPASQEFRSFLRQLSDGRKVRNPQIVQRLNELGMPITMEEVEQEAGVLEAGGAIDKSVGRPHIAAVMIRKGYVKTKQEAFNRFLAKGQLAYVPRFVASPEDSIARIHGAGGLAILAHPTYLRAVDDTETEQIVRTLKDQGLDGIEVWYSTHTPEQTALIARIAEKYDLVPSGGSDFHGELGRGGSQVELGSGCGNLALGYEVVEALKDRRARKRR